MEHDWYVIYTKSNCENKLLNCIGRLNNETDFECDTYLPAILEEIQWSDRKKKKRVPLFRNYLFVKHDDKVFEKIKRLPGFCEYVRFGNFPAVIKQEQVCMIKNALECKGTAAVSTKLMKGERVKILNGPMKDYEGVLVEDQKNSKVAIEIEYFNQCLLINVAHENIMKI